jgi:uncharacterized protein (TIRG00374 family)
MRLNASTQIWVDWLQRHWRLALGLLIVGILALFVYSQYGELLAALAIIRTAHPFWLVSALLIQAVVYFCFASVYWRSLQLLGYHLRLLSFYGIAFIAIFFGRVFPMGGTSTFAFLLYQFRRRGIPDGTGAVAVTLDGLSYLAAFFVLLLGGFIYLFTHGELRVNEVGLITVFMLLIIMVGMYLWGMSHDRALLTRRVLSIKDALARFFRQQWGDTKLLSFIAELYEGGALISRDRKGFIQLVALHMLALLFDCVTLLLLFWSVGEWPHFSVVVLGYSLAYFFSTISSLPGGGGTFEAAMAVTITTLGVVQPIALSITLLYRLFAFWLPLVITALIYRRVHGNRGNILKKAEAVTVPTRE